MGDITKGYVEDGVEFGPRPRPMPSSGPSEASEQLRVVAALRRAGVYFIHVPNGGLRGRGSGAEMRRLGAKRGFPDLLVLDAPPIGRVSHVEGGVLVERDGLVGVALELKRPVRGSRPSPDQIEHLERLAARGWLATVQWGADAALEYLRLAGYPV